MRLSQYGLITAKSWEWLSSAYPYVSLDEWISHAQPFARHHLYQSAKSGRFENRPYNTKTFAVKPISGRIQNCFQPRRLIFIAKRPEAPFWQRGFYEHVIRDEEA